MALRQVPPFVFKFLIFINDLPQCVASSTRLFADDAILYRKIESQTDQIQLQEDLDSVAAWEKKWGMEFHPQKCNVLRVSRAKSPLTFQYHLKGIQLSEEHSTKYLGVDLQDNLLWNQHIHQITKKANNMLGFLKRNLYKASSKTKTTAYNTLVRSKLEYCSTVWSPYRQGQIHKVEMVQRRAARFVTQRYRNTSSVSDMLQELGWDSLEERRKQAQLTMLYKIINEIIDIPKERYLTPLATKTRATHSKRLKRYSPSTDTFKYSFFPRTIPLWNTLPATVAEAPSLASFKREFPKPKHIILFFPPSYSTLNEETRTMLAGPCVLVAPR